MVGFFKKKTFEEKRRGLERQLEEETLRARIRKQQKKSRTKGGGSGLRGAVGTFAESFGSAWGDDRPPSVRSPRKKRAKKKRRSRSRTLTIKI